VRSSSDEVQLSQPPPDAEALDLVRRDDRCDDRPMRTFQVKTYGRGSMEPHPSSLGFQVVGYRAPGPGVVIVEEGTGWVGLPDGSRENLTAKSVVVYETNDWVEYGSDGTEPFRTRDYWAAMEPIEDWERRVDEIFGRS
jgi:hypothetical protein